MDTLLSAHGESARHQANPTGVVLTDLFEEIRVKRRVLPSKFISRMLVVVTLSESPGKRSRLAANKSGKNEARGFIISIKHPRYQRLIQPTTADPTHYSRRAPG
jgi:hypothetical protein